MRFRVNKFVALSLGLIVLLASCQRDATITIVGDGTVPEFVAKATGGKTCIDALTVSADNMGGVNAPILWRIDRTFGRGDADCRDRVVYGQTLAGYESDIAPKVLGPGKRYRVEVHGPGWTATKDWTLH
jgi:hypothetical protein